MPTVVIGPDGRARYILDEQHNELFTCLGEPAAIRRASHVDTTEDLSPAAREQVPHDARPNYWWADMSPVGGPVLGPYTSRNAALYAEVAWLLAHNIPIQQKGGNDEDGKAI